MERKSVLFWRADRWNVGWLTDYHIGEGYMVGWLENSRVYFKVVSNVIHIDVPAVTVQSRGE